jgi:Zn-dependent protease with chaperone function
LNHANQSFEAQLFHPALGNEVATGVIVVDRREFHFRSEPVTLAVPLHRLRVRVGAGADERIYIQDAESPDWEVFTADFAILDHPLLPQMAAAREQLSRDATKEELRRRWKLVGSVVAVLALLVWLCNLAVDGAVSALVKRVPPQMEQQLGDETLAEVQQEMAFLEDSNRVAQLAALIAPLTNAVTLGTNGLKLFIAEESDPNAFALPGGYVIVTTGMLDLVDRPEELLGVLAHELAHVERKHGIRSVISGAGPFLIFGVLLGGRGGVVGLLGNVTDAMVRSGFSQEYETEADEVGWQILLASKVDPRGMIDAFRKLQANEVQQESHDDTPQAFSSHPAVEKRIARLETKWKKLKGKTDFRDLSVLDGALRVAAGK